MEVQWQRYRLWRTWIDLIQAQHCNNCRREQWLKPVLVFGAGYDPNFDDNRSTTLAKTTGRGIFVVDAVAGDSYGGLVP